MRTCYGEGFREKHIVMPVGKRIDFYDNFMLVIREFKQSFIIVS